MEGIGQIEIDEIYVGVNQHGSHFIIPVQAKSKGDRLSIVQPDQDINFAAIRYPNMICYSIGAKMIDDNVIAMFRFEQTNEGPKVVAEAHYRLVPSDQISDDDLKLYRSSL